MLLELALYLHIAAGFTALVVGAVALLTKKGAKNHLLAGKIFYWAMTCIALSAVVLAIAKSITFLFLIAIFSYYMNFTGTRTLQLKNVGNGQSPALIDWVAFGIAAVGSATMIGSALLKYVPLPQAVGLFGLILLLFSLEDFFFLIGKFKNKKNWLLRHIRRMCGAYIATFTAFLVVNVRTDPAYIAWILPTVIGTPIILYYARSYSKS